MKIAPLARLILQAAFGLFVVLDSTKETIMEDADTQEEIQHQKNMLKALRQRLRDREIQEIKFGLSVTPEIMNDLRELRTRIAEHEAELSRLSTLAAEDKVSIKEAEYNVLLAEAWNLVRPSIVNVQRLELLRLRLGISPQRALELEWQIRKALTEEIFEEQGDSQIETFIYIWQKGGNYPLSTLHRVRDALLIHPIRAAELFFETIGSNKSPEGVDNVVQALALWRGLRRSAVEEATFQIFHHELARLNS
jgi:hypothetical protein